LQRCWRRSLSPPPPPADPITAIYRKVAAGKGEDGGNFVYQEKKDRARWLTASFAKAWNEPDAKTPKGDETPPGFDPVSNSQDPKVLNVKVELEKSDGKTATVAASFDSWSRGLTRKEQDRNPPDPRDRASPCAMTWCWSTAAGRSTIFAAPPTARNGRPAPSSKAGTAAERPHAATPGSF
jgi:hypothetical protein